MDINETKLVVIDEFYSFFPSKDNIEINSNFLDIFEHNINFWIKVPPSTYLTTKKPEMGIHHDTGCQKTPSMDTNETKFVVIDVSRSLFPTRGEKNVFSSYLLAWIYILYCIADMTSVLEFSVRHTKLAQSQFIDRWMAGLKDFNGAFHIYQTCLARSHFPSKKNVFSSYLLVWKVYREYTTAIVYNNMTSFLEFCVCHTKLPQIRFTDLIGKAGWWIL